MKDLLLNYLKNTLSQHIVIVVLGVFGFIAARSYLAEHDARLIAEQTVKTAQVQIASLQKQQTAVDVTARAQIAALQRRAAAVKTPAQAIRAIPDVSSMPLNVRTAPGLPDAVTVDAVPLFQELNACREDVVQLAACTTKLDLQAKIDGQKDAEIKALKKKPGFWHRVGGAVKEVGIGVAIGGILAALHGGL